MGRVSFGFQKQKKTLPPAHGPTRGVWPGPPQVNLKKKTGGLAGTPPQVNLKKKTLT